MTMSQHLAQVDNTEASYKIIGNNFEYCSLCRTVKPLYSGTELANRLLMCGTVQLQDFLQRLLRNKRAAFLGSTTELCHAQMTVTFLQQAVEEQGPSEPSALTFGSVCIARNAPKQVQGRKAREDIFTPSITETARSHPQQLVTGRL